MKAIERETSIKICEFVFMDDTYGHLMDAMPAEREKTKKLYTEALEVCKIFGAITELEYELGSQDPLPLFEPYRKMSAGEEQAFISIYREIAETAKGSSAHLLLEPINRYEAPYLNSMDDCIEMVDRVDRPNCGLLPDLFHMSIEEGDMGEAIRKAGKRIKHLHLGDNNRLMPGKGSIDWKSCIQALKDVGFEGFMNLECAILGDPEEELKETAAFLKNLVEE